MWWVRKKGARRTGTGGSVCDERKRCLGPSWRHILESRNEAGLCNIFVTRLHLGAAAAATTVNHM